MRQKMVGITGATGAIFGIRILQVLRELGVKTEVILSKWARVTIQHETEFTAPANLDQLKAAIRP